MPTAFDHVPVVTMTEYGPSIHNDPVAMDNETLRLAGITDLRWTGEALAVKVDVLGFLLGVLHTLAAEIAGPDGPEVIDSLKDLAWVNTHSDEMGGLNAASAIEDALLKVLGETEPTATLVLRGVAPLLLRDRLTDETPMEVFRAHRAILDARPRVIIDT